MGFDGFDEINYKVHQACLIYTTAIIFRIILNILVALKVMSWNSLGSNV